MRTPTITIVQGRIIIGLIMGLGVGALARPAAASEGPTERRATSRTDQQSAAWPEERTGTWTAGSSVGLLGATPDGTAFAMNGHVDYFVSEAVSLGPLVQVGLTGDMAQVGVSGQGKYWIDLPATEGRGRIVLQGGVGFVHSDYRSGDTSWLVPLGIGYDYAVNPNIDLSATGLLNFTNLHTGGGSDADVMPGLAFGVRF